MTIRRFCPVNRATDVIITADYGEIFSVHIDGDAEGAKELSYLWAPLQGATMAK